METDAVLRLVQEVAAEVITPRFGSLAAGEIGEKNPGDLVTVADRESERLLTRALTAAYPSAVVLGEEAVEDDPGLLDRYAAAEHAFTVDPVDGTKNFVHGSPDHAVMVAEVRAGEVVRGWIWQPQHEAAYVAERGAGAFRNGERLTSPQRTDDPASWLGTTARRSWVGRELPGLEPLVLSWACCGVDYPHVLEGPAAAGADYCVYGRAKPWDHAPGSLLLTEAGGAVSLADGSPWDPRTTGAGLVTAGSEAVRAAVVDALRTV